MYRGAMRFMKAKARKQQSKFKPRKRGKNAVFEKILRRIRREEASKNQNPKQAT